MCCRAAFRIFVDKNRRRDSLEAGILRHSNRITIRKQRKIGMASLSDEWWITFSSAYAESGKLERCVLSSSALSIAILSPDCVNRKRLWDIGGMPVTGSNFAFS